MVKGSQEGVSPRESQMFERPSALIRRSLSTTSRLSSVIHSNEVLRDHVVKHIIIVRERVTRDDTMPQE